MEICRVVVHFGTDVVVKVVLMMMVVAWCHLVLLLRGPSSTPISFPVSNSVWD